MNPLLGLYAPTLAIAFAQGMIFPAVPAIAARFGVSPGLAAQVVTAQVVGRMLALLPTGALVDRLGPWTVLLLGSTVILAGAGMIVESAFWALLLGQALVGVPLAGGLIADAYGAASAFVAYAPVLAVAALLLAFGARETLVRPARVPEEPSMMDE